MVSMLEFQSEHQTAAVVQGSSLHCSYSGPSLWNSVPCNLRQAEPLNLSNYMISISGKLRHGIHGKQVKFSSGLVLLFRIGIFSIYTF